MTPEEKAKSLFDRFRLVISEWETPAAKIRGRECAIICCDEIINICHVGPSGGDYWQQVKHHIQSL